MSITVEHIKESLCLAHIHALGGSAGLNFTARTTFDYGVDGEFKLVAVRGQRRIETGFSLGYQAKATVRWAIDDGFVVYDLEAKNYNDIATRTSEESTLILILLCLPPASCDWHITTSEVTSLRNCCYWYLPEQPGAVPNTGTKRIRIPLANLLTPDSLLNLMHWERNRRLGVW